MTIEKDELSKLNRGGKGTPGAYQITDADTGKMYIGSTNDLRRRLLDHDSQLLCNTHRNKELQEAFDSGHHLFANVFPTQTRDAAYDLEQMALDANTPDELLNRAYDARAPGGRRIQTEETRKKIGAIHKGKIVSQETRDKMKAYMATTKDARSAAMTGYKLTEEAKEKIRQARLGSKSSEETKRKISDAGKGRVASRETRERMSMAMAKRLAEGFSPVGPVGIKRSEETKEKMRQIAKNRVVSEETRAKLAAHLNSIRHLSIAAATGRIPSAETREKLSKAGMGNKNALGRKK